MRANFWPADIDWSRSTDEWNKWSAITKGASEASSTVFGNDH